MCLAHFRSFTLGITPYTRNSIEGRSQQIKITRNGEPIALTSSFVLSVSKS